MQCARLFCGLFLLSNAVAAAFSSAPTSCFISSIVGLAGAALIALAAKVDKLYPIMAALTPVLLNLLWVLPEIAKRIVFPSSASSVLMCVIMAVESAALLFAYFLFTVEIVTVPVKSAVRLSIAHLALSLCVDMWTMPLIPSFVAILCQIVFVIQLSTIRTSINPNRIIHSLASYIALQITFIPKIKAVLQSFRRLLRVFAALGLVLIFGYSLLSVKRFHIIIVPHILALLASVAIFLDMLGDFLHKPSLARAGQRLYNKLHLGVWDLLSTIVKGVFNIFPLLSSLITSLHDSLRTRFLPLLRAASRAVRSLFLLVWNKAAASMLAALGTIAIAYLFHQGTIDGRILQSVASKSYVLLGQGIHLLGSLLSTLSHFLAVMWNSFFSELNDQHMPLIEIARRAEMSFLFFLTNSLRSRFRYLRDIRLKFFVVPAFFIALSISLVRLWFTAILVLLGLWISLSVTVYFIEHSRIEKELEAIRKQRSAHQNLEQRASSRDIDVCTICFISLRDPALHATTLPCAHQFHEECIRQWFAVPASGHRCPYCRTVCDGSFQWQRLLF